MKGYYCPPSTVIKVRVFKEGPYWAVDGIDGWGGYTESCWTYDTWGEAMHQVPSFIREELS